MGVEARARDDGEAPAEKQARRVEELGVIALRSVGAPQRVPQHREDAAPALAVLDGEEDVVHAERGHVVGGLSGGAAAGVEGGEVEALAKDEVERVKVAVRAREAMRARLQSPAACGGELLELEQR